MIVKKHYSETPCYGQLSNTATSLLRPLCRLAKTAIHFLVKKTLVNTATPLIRPIFFGPLVTVLMEFHFISFLLMDFFSFLKNITMPQMFDYSLKDCYFHEVETILALMNVLAYVKCFNYHTNIIVFYNDYTFVLKTKLLTLMEIYIAEMKGKRCSSTGGKKFKRKHNQRESDRDTFIYYNYLHR